MALGVAEAMQAVEGVPVADPPVPQVGTTVADWVVVEVVMLGVVLGLAVAASLEETMAAGEVGVLVVAEAVVRAVAAAASQVGKAAVALAVEVGVVEAAVGGWALEAVLRMLEVVTTYLGVSNKLCACARARKQFLERHMVLWMRHGMPCTDGAPPFVQSYL